jgi:catechol 2,3-dioxygenase-like lactoylglutathione lyase family enzyme
MRCVFVVDDLAAAIAFFVELGLELEGEAPVEGRWVDRVVGLDGVRVDVAMMRTPDGHGRLELTKFRRPTAVSAEPKNAPANTLGIRRIMFAVEDTRTSLPACTPMAPNSLASWSSTRTAIGSATSAAPRASSSRWPSSSMDRLERRRPASQCDSTARLAFPDQLKRSS